MTDDDFVQTVRAYYRKHGRHNLPWRKTGDPYAILVSEVMLQQTQVPRVIPKYRGWLEQFPDIEALAGAPLDKVLAYWQGLGYNRRCVHLKQTAEIVTVKHGGVLPQSEDDLRALPGIGPYTAGAVRAFAWNLPVVFVETNIRSVYIHHFAGELADPPQSRGEVGSVSAGISDTHIKQKLSQHIERIANRLNTDMSPRKWYWALMDYGAHLKKEFGNPNKKSKSYNKQSKFKGSNRELRSKLLRFILKHQPVELHEITDTFRAETDRQKSVEANLADLKKEGFVSISNDKYLISNDASMEV